MSADDSQRHANGLKYEHIWQGALQNSNCVGNSASLGTPKREMLPIGTCHRCRLLQTPRRFFCSRSSSWRVTQGKSLALPINVTAIVQQNILEYLRYIALMWVMSRLVVCTNARPLKHRTESLDWQWKPVFSVFKDLPGKYRAFLSNCRPDWTLPSFVLSSRGWAEH